MALGALDYAGYVGGDWTQSVYQEQIYAYLLNFNKSSVFSSHASTRVMGLTVQS